MGGLDWAGLGWGRGLCLGFRWRTSRGLLEVLGFEAVHEGSKFICGVCPTIEVGWKITTTALRSALRGGRHAHEVVGAFCPSIGGVSAIEGGGVGIGVLQFMIYWRTLALLVGRLMGGGHV